ncbi:hypothetical protein ACQ4PT_060101 [Festuca glaucescens]
MADPSFLQSAPVSNEALQHKEFLFRGLYMQQRLEESPSQNMNALVNPNLPQHDWTIYDGPGTDAKLVARAQGSHTGTSVTKGTWLICFDIAFVHERFKDSSLNVLGNFESPVDGKCAILGGTGEFAYAQGVFSFKKVLELDNGKTRVRELEIRALCPNFSSSLPVPVKMEQRGGNGGFAKDMAVRESLRLESITIKSGSYVYSLAFTYVDNHGKRRTEGPWGGSEGNTQTIKLGPKEFVKEVSGTIDNVVSSLVLVTNVKTYGPFGQGQGQQFVQTAPENTCVVGFFGRSGAAIDAIGVYTGPILAEVKIGPWGGNGGFAKDMTVKESLLRLESVTIKSGSYIDSLVFSYVDTQGKRHTEGPWGGSGGNPQTIVLGPKEFVKKVTGTIDNGISSLVLVTNIKTYGPFGQERGQRFGETVPENTCVVGFFGRSGAALDALGVYTGPILV